MIDLAYSLKLITGPTVWVATAAEVRAWGRIVETGEDADILETIKSATGVMEVLANRIFCTQTFEMRLDGFPADGVIQLPTGPWQSITSVKARDVDGVEQTVTSTDYLLDEASGRLSSAPDIDWPDTQSGRPAAVRIQYKAGYGDAATACPLIAKRAVILGTLDELENRHGRFAIPNGIREKLMALWPGTI